MKLAAGWSQGSRSWRTLMLLVGAALIIALAARSTSIASADSPAVPAVHVGALLSLTGPSSTLGLTSQAALELAAADINGQPASAGLPHVSLTIEDTQLKPALALAAMQDLHAQGVQVVIGPQTSSELAAIKDYAGQNGMTIISQGSTASSLAIAGDSIFRLVPDDKVETLAMAALLQADGITAIVPVGRNDVGNQGLVSSLTTAFTAAGGTVAPAITYAADTTDFGPVVTQIEGELADLQKTSGAKPAIYLAAFSEVTGLFDSASQSAALSAVPWYGSDGVALSDALIDDPVAAVFAQKVVYPNPTVGLDQSAAAKAIWQPIANQIKDMTGMQPDTFGLAAYDALELIARTAAQVDPANTAKFDAALVAEANSSSGITGPLTLNAAGDRATSPFDFWQVCKVSGAYAWVVGDTWTPAATGPGTITRGAGCGPQVGCVGLALSGQWSLIAWPGSDTPVADAISGATGCGTDMSSLISVIWSFDGPTQTWHAYFPGVTSPGANDLSTLQHGAAYAVALVDSTHSETWMVPNS